MTDRFTGLEPYEPPSGDEPIDDIERAFIRLLVPAIAARIREELAFGQQQQTLASSVSADDQWRVVAVRQPMTGER